MQRVGKSTRIVQQTIGSMAELADLLEKADPSGEARHGSVGFCGATVEETLDMARNGWPDGAARAQALLSSLSLPPVEEQHSATYLDVTGAYVDIGEFVNGAPECMVNFRDDTRAARFARILVSASFSAAFPAENAMNRGIAIAAIVDSLESRGIRCTVDVVEFSGADGSIMDTVTSALRFDHNIKQAHEPLHLERLVFAVAHPAYLRRLIFAAMESRSKADRDEFGVTSRGYGRAIHVPPEPDTILFDTPDWREDWTEAGARARIEKTLAEFIAKDSPSSTDR